MLRRCASGFAGIVRPGLLVVKSLLSFASRMGFTPFNIGATIRPPGPDDRLPERILDELGSSRCSTLLSCTRATTRPRSHSPSLITVGCG